MEEAYSQLYQEFVRLRTLCVRQASLLRELTAQLRLQQGETNGDLIDVTSLPGQLDSEYPVYVNSETPILTTAAPCGIQGPSVISGTFSELLAQDLSKLTMDPAAAQKNEPKSELSVPQCLTSGMTVSYGDFNFGRQQHLNHHGDSEKPPVSDLEALLCSEAQNHEALLSEVALQSHVCEFCQAVFPGDTTTRGQYLQHIYTHIT